MSEKSFSKGEAIRFGWKTMNDNLGFFIVLSLIIIGLGAVPGFIAGSLEKSMPAVSGLINLISVLVSVFITPGYLKIFLKFCDGEKASLDDLFAFPQVFLTYLVAMILGATAVILGYVCLIIPGIILGIKFQFFGYFIVDKNAKIIESLQKSFVLTKGILGELFVFGLLIFLINLAGALCLLIGLFATIPTSALATAYVYRKLVSRHETTPAAAIPAV